MIQIKHSNLDGICEEYTKGVINAILKRVQYIKEVLELIQSPTVIQTADITGKYQNYNKPLQAVFNDKTLGAGNTEILAENLERKRTNHNHQRVINVTDDIEYFDEDSIRELVSGLPNDIKNTQENILNELNCGPTDMFLNYLFSYDDFYDKFIVPIAAKLELNVCPYCNRNYITHIPGKGDKRILGPTFDHFFHQAKNPLLTLSFYNLIPSCSPCNSNLKGQKKFELATHLHPYLYEIEGTAKFNFDLDLVETGKDVKIVFKPILEVLVNNGSIEYERLVGNNLKHTGSLKVFKLKEIYEFHYDSVEEIYSKFDKNSDHYIRSIAEHLERAGATEGEFYRFHFGNYFNPDEFHKRPLAKLNRDIYDKMKTIAPLFNMED